MASLSHTRSLPSNVNKVVIQPQMLFNQLRIPIPKMEVMIPDLEIDVSCRVQVQETLSSQQEVLTHSLLTTLFFQCLV